MDGSPEGGAEGVAERAPGILERLGDRLNPVLVKEVRQAQRGKVFTVALVVTVLVTLLACVIMAVGLDDRTSQPGREFFTAIYVFVCVALLLVVPFQAFSSMGSEWDDHTYEMLVLSNLKPSQIVLGKILAAMTQAALLLAVFLPFLATAFLLRGVDMLVLGVVLLLTAYASVWVTTIAIMLSSITRNRLVRLLLMIFLWGGLGSIISGAVGLSQEFIDRPDQLADADFWIAVPQVLVVATVVGILAFVITCNLLAHEEENRSSNVRILVTCAIIAFFGLLAVNTGIPKIALPREIVFGLSSAAMLVLAIFGVFFCTEPEALGRRVRSRVPKGSALALVTLPWYPGSGRGVAYLLLHMAGIIAAGFTVAVFAEYRSILTLGVTGAEVGLMREGGIVLVLSSLYAVLYTLVPIGFLGLFIRNTAGRRKVVRSIVIFSPFLYVLIPAIVGLIIGDEALRGRNHVGNSVKTISRSFGDRIWHQDGVFFVLVPLALLGLVLALPKIFRAVRETAGAHQPLPATRLPAFLPATSIASTDPEPDRDVRPNP